MMRKQRGPGRWRRRFYRRKINLKKGLLLLPNLFTFGNVLFGFCAVLFIAEARFYAAAHCILLAALMDALDGRTARLVGVTSEFGVQLDSLADVISFCFVPSFLIYSWQLKYLGFFGLAVSFLFLVAGIIRLARFNIIHAQQMLFFLGLPTTIAGCFLATVVLNVSCSVHSQLLSLACVALVLVLSWLMVSSLPFPSFKQRIFKSKKNWVLLSCVLFFVIIAAIRVSYALLALFLFYFVYSCAWMFMRKKSYPRALMHNGSEFSI